MVHHWLEIIISILCVSQMFLSKLLLDCKYVPAMTNEMMQPKSPFAK